MFARLLHSLNISNILRDSPLLNYLKIKQNKAAIKIKIPGSDVRACWAPRYIIYLVRRSSSRLQHDAQNSQNAGFQKERDTWHIWLLCFKVIQSQMSYAPDQKWWSASWVFAPAELHYIYNILSRGLLLLFQHNAQKARFSKSTTHSIMSGSCFSKSKVMRTRPKHWRAVWMFAPAPRYIYIVLCGSLLLISIQNTQNTEFSKEQTGQPCTTSVSPNEMTYAPKVGRHRLHVCACCAHQYTNTQTNLLSLFFLITERNIFKIPNPKVQIEEIMWRHSNTTMSDVCCFCSVPSFEYLTTWTQLYIHQRDIGFYTFKLSPNLSTRCVQIIQNW